MTAGDGGSKVVRGAVEGDTLPSSETDGNMTEPPLLVWPGLWPAAALAVMSVTVWLATL